MTLEDVLEFIEDNRVVRRLFTWGLPTIALVFLVAGPYKLIRVTGIGMGPDITPTSHYLTSKPHSACIGDYLKFKHDDRTLVRQVTALEGATFTIHPTGHSVDAAHTEMSHKWVMAAREKLSPKSGIKVPNNHILFMRTDPDAVEDDKYESFVIVKSDQVERRISRIFTSTNLSRIGENLKGDPDKCMTLSVKP